MRWRAGRDARPPDRRVLHAAARSPVYRDILTRRAFTIARHPSCSSRRHRPRAARRLPLLLTEPILRTGPRPGPEPPFRDLDVRRAVAVLTLRRPRGPGDARGRSARDPRHRSLVDDEPGRRPADRPVVALPRVAAGGEGEALDRAPDVPGVCLCPTGMDDADASGPLGARRSTDHWNGGPPRGAVGPVTRRRVCRGWSTSGMRSSAARRHADSRGAARKANASA